MALAEEALQRRFLLRLPERLPAVAPPGLLPIGVYRRFEDEHGNLVSQVSCGIVDLSISEGYRSEAPFHDGRFVASVTWNTSGQDHSGFAVPADLPATDSALFWEVTAGALDAALAVFVQLA
jgi:hypothetical protein